MSHLNGLVVIFVRSVEETIFGVVTLGVVNNGHLGAPFTHSFSSCFRRVMDSNALPLPPVRLLGTNSPAYFKVLRPSFHAQAPVRLSICSTDVAAPSVPLVPSLYN